MSEIVNKTALITGGAMGIGKLMGEMLLQKGLRLLVIWDLDENALKQTATEFAEQGFRVMPYLVDVTDTKTVIDMAREVNRETGGIDILVNNAGIVVGKPFAQYSHQDIDRTMQVNSSALMHITREFLPGMIERKEGHIVNIASAAGMTGNPDMSVYVASKWAVIGWSDSLRLEMEKYKHPVKLTTVTPYYISTGMFEGVKSRAIRLVEPKSAASRITRGIQKNKRYVRMPGIVYLLPFAKGILPVRWFDVLVGKWLGIYRSMDAFKGRQK